MLASILKFAAKSYAWLIGLVALTVLAAFVILLGLVGFVHLVIPG